MFLFPLHIHIPDTNLSIERTREPSSSVALGNRGCIYSYVCIRRLSDGLPWKFGNSSNSALFSKVEKENRGRNFNNDVRCVINMCLYLERVANLSININNVLERFGNSKCNI